MVEKLNVAREVAALRRMTVKGLRGRYAEVFGEATRSGNKDWLWKRIAWRMQANAEGGLSERARRRAEELADNTDLRVRRPPDKPAPSPGSTTTKAKVEFGDRAGALMPGTILTRPYKGRMITVVVLDDGFECDGDVYRSLSAVAKAVTGSHWNGNYFFGVKGRRGG
ncbi:MAG: DUF2924 domain-containing protein [Phycisphaerae bacterium]|nr:DUF2924 domain-containing protein [Phycisphaerae bacterium]